jgi:hypothetical protein
VYVNIELVSYLPKVGGSIASFIVSLALAFTSRTGLRTKQTPLADLTFILIKEYHF